MKLTKEQTDIINSSGSICINAVAGSGKTTTLIEYAKARDRNYRILYIAFNKSVRQEAIKKFREEGLGNVTVETAHSLAYRHIVKGSNFKVNPIGYRTYEIASLLGLRIPGEKHGELIAANHISKFITYFCNSASEKVSLLNYCEVVCEPEANDFAKKHYDYIETQTRILLAKMNSAEIGIIHDFYLKKFQLSKPQLNYDYILFDEGQDVVAVTLEIFKLINANQKLILGDKYQNIYSFMNTVNAFEELDNLNTLKLTKSFRCNPYIADIVENYGKTYLDTDFAYKGNEVIQPEDTFKVAYVTRTNAMLIERMHNLLSEGQTFTLTRNVNEIFALPMALLNAATGKPVYDKRYKYLEKEYKNFSKVRSNYRNFYEYISIITEDPLLDSVTRTLMSFFNKRINIYDLKQKVQEIRKPNPNVVLTTAHAFKGLEMDSVFIEDDLNNSVNRTIQRMQELSPTVSDTSMIDTRQYLSKEQKEDLNTYYVALSRAKTIITNVGHY